MDHSQELGTIGQIEEEGLPVVFKLVDEAPSSETRDRFRWLTVISWRYDRSLRNGMPPQDANEEMLALEHAIDALEESMLCRHAYSRTGNGLKELVYYIADREQFMTSLNDTLSGHPPYRDQFLRRSRLGRFREIAGSVQVGMISARFNQPGRCSRR